SSGGEALGARPNEQSEPSATDIAFEQVEADASIEVTSTFGQDERIAIVHAAQGHNASPALSLSGADDDTASYVVIVDDPDAAEPKPFTHWIVYDIPAEVTELREGLPPDPILQEPEGVLQGTNSRGQVGYFGPQPPVADEAHDYHFQVFALDVGSLELDPGAEREEVLAAMEGHVLTKGQCVRE